MKKQKTAAVIGSGISGLTAAYELQKSGWDVSVFEKSDWIGGRMANVKNGRMLMETGATEMFSFYHDLLGLVREFGLSDQLVETPYLLSFHIIRKEIEYDFSYAKSLAQLLTSPALSMRSKARLPFIADDLLKFRMKGDPCFLDSVAEYDDEDLASYLTRRVGRDFVDGFMAPLFRVFFRWQPEEVSSAYFLSFFAHSLGCKAYTFNNGIGALTQELGKRVGVQLGCEVKSVVENEKTSGVTLEIKKGDGESVREEFDIAVCSAEAFHVPKIVQDLSAEDKAFFESVRYAQGMAANYLLNKSVEPKSLVYASDHPSPILSCAQVPQGIPGFPDVPDRLWVSLTPEYLEQHVAEDGSNLDEITRPLVKELIYPDLEEDLLEAHMQYEGLRIVLVYPGYIRKQKEFLERKSVNPGAVFYCGDYLAHPHTGGACASGKSIATQIRKRYAASTAA